MINLLKFLWYRLPFTKRKTFTDYVEPLQKMVTKLENYVTWRDKHILKQEKARMLIEMDIRLSRNEIKNSQTTISKLNKIFTVDDFEEVKEEVDDSSSV